VKGGSYWWRVVATSRWCRFSRQFFQAVAYRKEGSRPCCSSQSIAKKLNYSRKVNLLLVTLDHGDVSNVGAIYCTNKNLCPVQLRRC
jgi:hypothetical protein